ncbi:MAG: NUDIX hydrolase [Planctomycetota bacterium]
MPTPDTRCWIGLRERLAVHRPMLIDADAGRRAATAVILHWPSVEQPEVLLMQRAERVGDYWSGQIAFPGGHRDDDDADLAATARREAAEEVGATLAPPFARLDDVQAATGKRTIVSPFVFVVHEPPKLRLDEQEVSRAFWLPLTALLDAEAAVSYEPPGRDRRYPALRYGESLVWGLTYRTLEQLARIQCVELPRSRND